MPYGVFLLHPLVPATIRYVLRLQKDSRHRLRMTRLNNIVSFSGEAAGRVDIHLFALNGRMLSLRSAHLVRQGSRCAQPEGGI